ncbi:MAG: hypothetical protein L0Y64_02960 [Myxococcaceae bacterium]|nr:hypothetical protein [Myxococcaceae bacterium]
MRQQSYDYGAILADSLKVGWRVEDILGEGKALDFTRPFLPEGLAGVQDIRCLSTQEHVVLNHIRGNSYLHLFGFVEEFILPFVMDHARKLVHGENLELRAMITFAEEEAKHMHTFRRFADEFSRGFGSPCGVIGPAKDVAAAVLSHSSLGVALVTLHLEWLTLQHYLQSVRSDQSLDPLFVSLLRHHWMEEAQHAKLDTLLILKMASTLGPADIERGFDDYLAIGKMLHEGLMGQARLDLESLSHATGRTFSAAEQEDILRAQERSYRRTFLGMGMVHPQFVQTLGELSLKGQARVAEVAKVFNA